MRITFCQFVAGLVAFLTCSLAFAWGDAGHRVVAEIATRYLTPDARKQVAELLRDDRFADGLALSNRKTLGQIASWADEINAVDWGKALEPSHYVRIPVCGSAADSEVCPNGTCITAQLKRQIAILKDKSALLRNRNEALKWVVNLVADIHQPLNVASNGDRGGNDIQASFFGNRDNSPNGTITLHAVWDDFMVNRMLTEEGGEYAFELEPIDARDKTRWEKGSIDDWIDESHNIAVTSVYSLLPGFACNTKITGVVAIDGKYYARAKPILATQLRKAGVRLAKVLNDALAK